MPERPPFRVSVASPCSKDWNQMTGTAQKRFCGGCQKHVYDLSAMRWDEVKELLEARGPTPCVRFFQRADGTVMTADCPVGRERARRRLRQALSMVAAVALGALALVRGLFSSPSSECEVSPLEPVEGLFSPAPEPSSSTSTSANPPDEGWMAQRRAQLPGGERLTQGRAHLGLMMGVIRSQNIQIIRANAEKPK